MDSGANPALAKAEPVSRLGPPGFDPGEALPQMFRAFRTTESGPDGYRMVFKFRTMDAMFDADKEWHTFRKQEASPARDTEAAIANLRLLQPALNTMASECLGDIIADLEIALARIEAGTDETRNAAQPVGREPDKLQRTNP